MDLSTLWRRLIKRPFVLVVILVLSALAGYAGWSATEGEAESKGAIVVIPPWYVESEVFPNPVLNLTERTTNLASALIIALQRRDVGSFVLAEGATDYTMSNLGDNLRDPNPSAVIQFTVTGPNEQSAHAGAQRLVVQARQILKEMQIEAAVGNPTTMANLQVIVQPQETEAVVGKRQLRAALLFGVATFFAGIIVFWTIESLRDRRSRSRSRDRGSDFAPEDGVANFRDSVDLRSGNNESRHSAENGTDADMARVHSSE